MKQLFVEMKKCLEQKEDMVFVTVVASSGATPRAAGARMLVSKKGHIWGTVGGGAVEYHSEKMAMEAIQNHTSCMKEYTLKRNEVEDIGMICGGDVTLYFKYIEGNDSKMLELCELALKQFNEEQSAWLVTELATDRKGEMGLYSKKLGLVGIEDEKMAELLPTLLHKKTCKFQIDGTSYYAEEMLTPGYVYIFGGGHVSRALVPVLTPLGFRCKVFEDRADFITPEIFPDAVERKVIDDKNIEDMAKVTEDDYIVIMTRGHKSDKIIEEQAMRTPAKYIGVIGSKHKKAKVEKELIEQGFTKEDLERVTTPIGLLSIGAETPEEIAISIAAQLIGVRAGKGVIL